MIKFIDLFSGIGGIRLAFENVGCECIMSSEIDKYACNTYFDNFNEYPMGDIKMIESSIIPDFDILAAGFPCQPFSLAGLRRGFEDSRGTLFFDIARIIKDKQPKAFLLENVAGIVNHDKGNTLNVIEDILKELGYNIEWRLMNAKEYGVPQNRNRWYCVGFRGDLNIKFGTKREEFNFPEKSELIFKLSDIIIQPVNDSYTISAVAEKNILSRLDSKLSSSENMLIAYDIRPSRCHFRSDNISPCLTAKMGTGGNNVPVIVSEKRKLTEEECLRLMGFPESFVIEKNTSQSYKQIGNSVVVPVVELLAREIVRLLKGDI